LFDGRILEIDFTSGNTLRYLTRLPYQVGGVEISPDGRWLACVGVERKVTLLTWPGAALVWRSEGSLNFGGTSRIASFSPDSRLLVTPAADDVCSLSLWEVRTGQRLGDLHGHTKAISGAKFAEGGSLFSWGTDGTIRSWDAARQRMK